jgi:hypothetical protein
MLDNQKLESFKRQYKFIEFCQKTFDIGLRSGDALNTEEKICQFYYITGPVNPYYKYFLAKDDDYKDNLIMLHQAIRDKRYLTASAVFVGYNIVKAVLWRYGYFAHFFFHTRMMSVVIYALSMRFIQQRFKYDLRGIELWRYYNKRNRTKQAEEQIQKRVVKEMIIKERLQA